MDNTNKDLFDIRLTAEGSAYMQKSLSVARWFIALGILGAILTTIFICLEYFLYLHFVTGESWDIYFRKYISPLLGLFQLACLLIQIIFYYKFLKTARQSILLNDTDAFNRSFRLFYKSSVFCLVQFFINILTIAPYLVISINLLSTLKR